MTHKERYIQVLLVDDKEDDMVEFKVLASQNGIIIRKAVKSAEEGLEELNLNFINYQAVILDAKALRKADHAKGTENMGALRDCINGINEIERSNNRKIPYCVYTGYMEMMGEAWEEDLKIFTKGSQQEELFAYIKEEVKRLPETKILWEFSDVFDLFDLGYLEEKYKEALLFVLLNRETQQKQELASAATHLRKILEGIYKKLHSIGKLPDSVVRNGRPNLEWSYLYLTGQRIKKVNSVPPGRVVPEHIGWSIKIVKENSSAFGAHDYEQSIHNFTLKTTVFALLDVLLWLKQYIKDNS